MTGISPPFAKLTVLVTCRVLPGRATPHALIAKVVGTSGVGRGGGPDAGPHPPDATGMLAAIVAPLAAGNVPVWVAASFDGDIVMIPADRMGEASELLRRAGHRVIS